MKKIYVLILMLAMVLSGCGPQTTPTPPTETMSPSTNTPVPPTETLVPTATETRLPTATPTETLTPTPAVIGPGFFPEGLNPLTGKLPADPQLLERRPIGVKINLVPRRSYRPPYGLSLADLVFDYYHNDGYSRIHAIFYGNDAELVGGIRSGRMVDGDLVRMYKSIFAYGSADQKINNRLLNSDFADRLVLEGAGGSCPPTEKHPMCRLANTAANLMVTSTKALQGFIEAKGVDNSRQDLSGMSFSDVIPEGGETGTQVYIRYSGDNYTRWDYDPGTGRYLRFQDDVWDNSDGENEKYVPLVDALNDQQIIAENVVVIIVRHEYYQSPPAEIVDILLSGSGTAYIYRDGQAFEVVWNRPNINSVLFLTDLDGNPFPFKPGQTWFQVIGVSSEVTQPSAESWRFVHYLP